MDGSAGKGKAVNVELKIVNIEHFRDKNMPLRESVVFFFCQSMVFKSGQQHGGK